MMVWVTTVDMIAILWFFIVWFGYTWFADSKKMRVLSVSHHVDGFRKIWMKTMMVRELQMVDVQILTNLSNGIAFFASTTIFVLGGLIAMLGAADAALAALSAIPFAIEGSQDAWRDKVILLIVMFIYAFFKFAWALRLSNYCSIMVGAACGMDNKDDISQHAKRAAKLNTLVGKHFNRGLRSYFFALAALSWFVHPVLMILATTFVILVLYRREFRSKTLMSLSE